MLPLGAVREASCSFNTVPSESMTYARWWWCQLFFYSAPPCSSVYIMGHDLACIAYKIGWLLLVLWLYANRNIWACPGQWAYSRLVCGCFSVCVCVSFSAFMHIMWMHVYVCCWPSMLCRLLLLSDLNRALGEVRMSTSLCLPPLTHTIRPEWISFAVSDRWTTGYLQVKSRHIIINGKSV